MRARPEPSAKRLRFAKAREGFSRPVAHAGPGLDPIPKILFILSSVWLGAVLQEDAESAEHPRQSRNPSWEGSHPLNPVHPVAIEQD